MMNFRQSYGNYKDSGIDWIKEIPLKWSIERVRNVTCNTAMNLSVDEIKKREWFYYDIPTVQQLNDGKITNGKNIESNKFIIKGGELLISKLNPRKATVVLTEHKELPIICSTEFVALMTREINAQFLYYVLSTNVIADLLNSYVKSVTNSHQRVNPNDIKNLFIPVASTKEQEAIVEFLDNHIQEIDSLIEKKINMIGLIEEKRQAIITEAVTKGLNPNVKMKNSGVKWIGEIPEHWEISKIKYQAYINKNILSEQTDEYQEINYIDISSVNSKGEISNVESYIFKEAPSRARRIVFKGDTIVSTVRTYLKAIATIEKNEKNLICSTGFAVLTPKKNIDAKYLSFLFKTSIYIDEIVSRSTGVSYPAINASEIGNLECILPTLEEQQVIVNFIESSISEIDKLVKVNIKQIEKLKEYRQSLVYEAVTGKIDIRDVEIDS